MNKLSATLFTFSLFFHLLNSAYACQSPQGEKPASIAQKAQNSTYVFDGVVTELTDTDIKIKVTQYFKGSGFAEVTINKGFENSCSDQFEPGQHGLFFTKGNMNELLDLVYDGSFGSVRDMNADNFAKITAATECMATYENGRLTAPCIIHKETEKLYQALLDPISSTGNLKFSVSDVQPMEINNSRQNVTTTGCMATYENGKLTVPCIAYKQTQKVYLATLDPIGSTEDLNFSVSHVTPISKIQPDMQAIPSRHKTQHFTHFDDGKAGTIINQWKTGVTGAGNSNWKLEKDSLAPSSPLVLNQSAYGLYPWCVRKETNLTDGFVAVKLKAISGKIDQAASLIWRWKDVDNYYVARANALENNVSIYYMKDGLRL